MDVRALECFLAVATEGSISRAAAALHMTQPPLSVRLQSLERELGVTLLTRHGRGVELTAAGRLLAERGRRILADLATTADQVRAVGLGTKGSLTLAIGHTVSPRLLPRFGVAVSDEIDLRLLELADDDAVERVHRREAQAGLLHLPPSGPGGSRHALGAARGLEVAVVTREPLVLVLPAAHPAAGHERVDLTALDDGRVSTTGAGLAAHTRAVWDQVGPAGYDHRHEATSVLHALSLVESGAGVALLPAQVTSLLWPGLVARPARQHTPVVETGALWRADEDSPVLRRFLRAALSTPEPDVLGPHLRRVPGAGG
ncbi:MULTISPECIES: LysR family transcriptional regulator [Pseudonocardia]|uniref:Hca operon transcriptional activator n=2 Tax=Pseudonocardia TaxID=1847 RepID=A0A1Y2MSZ2_PSEAH|nr:MULTISPECIES: LysR family transcriptional regulator [Pseudonocardia]OSY38330.1 Hca operon transcriptional activator [Pseudonocardia autotrophica]TDN72625.1 DNA-binding transcriptional LysR family regulator [Pseudonocardia autotrophica]BBG03334.1 LysR family transcriptional regulator [Pseudonocardia autotrophica]GEC24592.1 LysR family transcriptional regulator [Pseudonocardia saturnea]